MSRITGWALLCALTFFLGTAPPAVGQATLQSSHQQSAAPVSAILYDNFHEKWLDPNRWYAGLTGGSTPDYYEACYYSSNVLECIREIQAGHLRLEVRGYGETSSNQGDQYGEAKLIMSQPQGVKSLTADVVVVGASASDCPANPGSFSQAMMTASFFNSGSGLSADNVSANVSLEPTPSVNPSTITIIGNMAWEGKYTGYVTIGTVPMGTPVRATLAWDHPGHQFVIGFQNLITGEFLSADVPYTQSDTLAPSGDWKGLYVQVFPNNCVSQQTWESMEATFDNVMITR